MNTAHGMQRLKLSTRPFSALQPRRATCLTVAAQRPARLKQQQISATASTERVTSQLSDALPASFALWVLSEVPAISAELSGGPPASSYYVSLGLFLITLPGLWSLIKRAPKAKVRRRTYEVPGPGQEGAKPLDARAREIFQYFKRYNYEVKGTGDVITFVGNYKASTSQAAALVAYTLISLACTALVLSIAAPWGGNWWYALCLISPAAGTYYMKNADRQEEVRVKMVTSDDDKTTDITVEGDEEELDRLSKELGLMEKGKVYVKGLFERE